MRSRVSYLMPSSVSASWLGQRAGVAGFAASSGGIPMCSASLRTCVLYRSINGEMSAATSPHLVKYPIMVSDLSELPQTIFLSLFA